MAAKSQSDPSPARVVDFLEHVGRLKRVVRAGWQRRKVAAPESVADHMYRMAVCAMLAPSSTLAVVAPVAGGSASPTHALQLDTIRCVHLALAHDMAEAIVGDITPYDNVSKEEKHRREEEAMAHICRPLGAAGDRLIAFFSEYNAGTTPEARFVKDVDKLDMILQALEYEREQGIQLGEFFASVSGRWQTTVVEHWAHEVMQRRTRFHIGKLQGDAAPAADACPESSAVIIASWRVNLKDTILVVGGFVLGAAAVLAARAVRAHTHT